MAKNTIKIRAKTRDAVTRVKTLIKHKMQGNSTAASEAHFIQEVVCEHNGALVLKANWSNNISRNPYLSFEFEGGTPGDQITVSWIDNMGDSDSLTSSIT